MSATRFSSLPRKLQVAYLASFGLSSLCIAYLLDTSHKQIRRCFRTLGLQATTKHGGECVGAGTSALIRVLAGHGLPEQMVAAFGVVRPSRVRRTLARTPR